MNSGGHRGFTVVTIIVLIFAPFFSHHEWMWRLVGQRTETHVEQCAPKRPCPAQRVIVTVEREPAPSGGTQGGHDEGHDQGGNGGGNGGGNDQGGHNQGGGDHGGGGDGHGKGRR